MDKVLITGATGFIGSHVARMFCEKGIDLCCLVRKGSSLKNIEGLPVELRYGDVEEKAELSKALEGVGFVIHIAGCARDWGSYGKFYKANVEGTLNILEACCEKGVCDVIITASNSVYGEEDSGLVKNEESPLNSHYRYFFDKLFPSKLNCYRDTKACAKGKAMEYAREKGLNLTVIEPVWVYGEREFNTGFYEYLKTAKSGVPFLPGSKKNKFHVVYAGDLARAYFLAYEKKLKGINSIIIGNREAEKMERIYTLFCREAGIKKPRNLPKFLVYPLGFLMELLYTAFNSANPPLLTRGRVNMFYDNIEYSTKKAARLLGFTNRYSLDEGIKKTVKWYMEQSLI